MIKAKINNELREFEAHPSILDACRAVGIDIPTLCHDERLKPILIMFLAAIILKGFKEAIGLARRAVALTTSDSIKGACSGRVLTKFVQARKFCTPRVFLSVRPRYGAFLTGRLKKLRLKNFLSCSSLEGLFTNSMPAR